MASKETRNDRRPTDMNMMVKRSEEAITQLNVFPFHFAKNVAYRKGGTVFRFRGTILRNWRTREQCLYLGQYPMAPI